MHAFWFRLTDIHVFTSFQIYFILLVIFYTCMPESHHLIMHTCDYLSMPLGFIICTRGLHLTTLDSHIQISEAGPLWPYCSWSECAADPSVTIGVQQKLGSSRSSSSQFPFCLALEALLLYHEHLSAFILYISSCIVLWFFFWWCNIPVILYHSLWWPCTALFLLECILPPCFRTLILACTDA